jgi:hypothetical protein
MRWHIHSISDVRAGLVVEVSTFFFTKFIFFDPKPIHNFFFFLTKKNHKNPHLKFPNYNHVHLLPRCHAANNPHWVLLARAPYMAELLRTEGCNIYHWRLEERTSRLPPLYIFREATTSRTYGTIHPLDDSGRGLFPPSSRRTHGGSLVLNSPLYTKMSGLMPLMSCI